MNNVIRKNARAIIMVASIVAFSFLVLNLFPMFDNVGNNFNWVALIYLGLEIAASIILFFIVKQSKPNYKNVSIPALLFVVARFIDYLQRMIENPCFGNVPLLGFSIALIILWIIYISNHNVKKVLLILMLVLAIYDALFIFTTGRIHAVALVAIAACLMLSLLFEGEENENQ